jgi:predicted nucleotidyltransferase
MYTEKDFEAIRSVFVSLVPGLQELVLFGGWAREESDIDIAAIVSERPRGRERRALLNSLYRALSEKGYAVDILFKPEVEFEIDGNIPVTMAHTIAAEGRVLWTKRSAFEISFWPGWKSDPDVPQKIPDQGH